MESTQTDALHLAAEDVVLLSLETPPRRSRVNRRKSRLPPLPLPDNDLPAPGFYTGNLNASTTALSSGRTSSPAQKIAADYRAAHAGKENMGERASSPIPRGQQPIGSHPINFASPAAPSAVFRVLVEDDDVPEAAGDMNERSSSELIARFRQSRLDDLDDAVRPKILISSLTSHLLF